jgi:prevent-host-death family protein
MDLRRRLGEILDAASVGERILIERDHKPLAYLVSYEDGARIAGPDPDLKQRQLAALDALAAMGQEWRRSHPEAAGGSSVDAVRWDRDHRDDQKYERSFGDTARRNRQKQGPAGST